MKLKIFQLILVIFLFINLKITAQVGIGTTSPNATSMLDIQSTSKGILIPRMTTIQRDGIASPSTGLMVFDSNTQSFWYYSGAWVELSTGSPNKIIDANGDTSVEVEKTTNEDKIHFTTNGSERMTIDNVGNTRIGDGTNNTYIESDGSLRYEGTATRWEDLKVSVNSLKDRGVKLPDWAPFVNNGGSSQGVYTFWFDSSEEQELFFTVQMPHSWKEGSTLYPHIHWTSLDSGNGKVGWGLEYTWTNVLDTFDNTTIIYGDTPIDSSTSVTEYKHYITKLGTIVGSGKTLSSMLVCRVFRDARSSNTNDNFSHKAGILEIDFHYEVDSDGSRQEYIK